MVHTVLVGSKRKFKTTTTLTNLLILIIVSVLIHALRLPGSVTLVVISESDLLGHVHLLHGVLSLIRGAAVL